MSVISSSTASKARTRARACIAFVLLDKLSSSGLFTVGSNVVTRSTNPHVAYAIITCGEASGLIERVGKTYRVSELGRRALERIRSEVPSLVNAPIRNIAMCRVLGKLLTYLDTRRRNDLSRHALVTKIANSKELAHALIEMGILEESGERLVLGEPIKRILSSEEGEPIKRFLKCLAKTT